MKNHSLDTNLFSEQRPKFEIDLKILRAHEVLRREGRIVGHGKTLHPNSNSLQERHLRLSHWNLPIQRLLRLIEKVILISLNKGIYVQQRHKYDHTQRNEYHARNDPFAHHVLREGLNSLQVLYDLSQRLDGLKRD